MPSRKRNKGKERTAKHAAEGSPAAAEMSVAKKCDHGLADLLGGQEGHPVRKFVAAISEARLDRHREIHFDVSLLFREVIRSHIDVLSNADNRHMAAEALTMLGMNAILSVGGHLSAILGAFPLFLGQWGDSGDFARDFKSAHLGALANKLRNFTQGTERNVLKFYAKRIKCLCLKEACLKAKESGPVKFSQCDHCQQRKERASMETCWKCKVNLYCSRECQVADWRGHRAFCEAIVSHQAMATRQ